MDTWENIKTAETCGGGGNFIRITTTKGHGVTVRKDSISEYRLPDLLTNPTKYKILLHWVVKGMLSIIPVRG